MPNIQLQAFRTSVTFLSSDFLGRSLEAFRTLREVVNRPYYYRLIVTIRQISNTHSQLDWYALYRSHPRLYQPCVGSVASTFFPSFLLSHHTHTFPLRRLSQLATAAILAIAPAAEELCLRLRLFTLLLLTQQLNRQERSPPASTAKQRPFRFRLGCCPISWLDSHSRKHLHQHQKVICYPIQYPSLYKNFYNYALVKNEKDFPKSSPFY